MQSYWITVPGAAGFPDVSGAAGFWAGAGGAGLASHATRPGSVKRAARSASGRIMSCLPEVDAFEREAATGRGDCGPIIGFCDAGRGFGEHGPAVPAGKDGPRLPQVPETGGEEAPGDPDLAIKNGDVAGILEEKVAPRESPGVGQD